MEELVHLSERVAQAMTEVDLIMQKKSADKFVEKDA